MKRYSIVARKDEGCDTWKPMVIEDPEGIYVTYEEAKAESTQEHTYISTACYHGLHDRCRQSCKFCSTPCRCDCGHKAGNAEAQLKGRE